MANRVTHALAAAVIRLEVIGLPAPQGSKTRMPSGAMVDGSSTTGRAKLTEWRRAVADQARAHLAEHPDDRVTGPCYLSLNFTFPRPAGDPYRTRHRSKPDLDKIVRATLDALVHAGLLADDALVCSLSATKFYGRPGCSITVFDGTKDEADDRALAKDRAAELRRVQKASTTCAESTTPTATGCG